MGDVLRTHLWRGLMVFECPFCAFDSFEEQAVHVHVASRHWKETPSLPSPVTGGGDGEPVVLVAKVGKKGPGAGSQGLGEISPLRLGVLADGQPQGAAGTEVGAGDGPLDDVSGFLTDVKEMDHGGVESDGADD